MLHKGIAEFKSRVLFAKNRPSQMAIRKVGDVGALAHAVDFGRTSIKVMAKKQATTRQLAQGAKNSITTSKHASIVRAIRASHHAKICLPWRQARDKMKKYPTPIHHRETPNIWKFWKTVQPRERQLAVLLPGKAK